MVLLLPSRCMPHSYGKSSSPSLHCHETSSPRDFSPVAACPTVMGLLPSHWMPHSYVSMERSILVHKEPARNSMLVHRVARKTVGSMLEGELRFLFGHKKSSSEEDKVPPAARHPDLEAIISELQGCSKLDTSLCALALRKCGLAKALGHGKQVHLHVLQQQQCSRSDSIFLGNLAVQMYGRCGDLTLARRAFDSMQHRNKFSWSLMLSSYAQNGHHREALDLYQKLSRQAGSSGIELDDVLLVTVIGVCAFLGDLDAGREVHSRVTGNYSPIVHSALINLYGKCNRISDAKQVFDAMPHRDAKCWNSMISVYAQNGDYAREALQLFRDMAIAGMRPDVFTYSAVLAACSSVGDLARGKIIHMSMINSGIRPDLALENALINMYGKCGSMTDARRVFDSMCRKDVISWTCIVGGYAANGQSQEALKLYRSMTLGEAGVYPNNITHSNALCACAVLGDLAQGREIHARFRGELVPSVVGCALINMYAKCSCLDEARSVFDNLQLKDLACGNSMLAAYAQFGHLKECQQVLTQMVLDGAHLNAVTLVSLLIGCSYAGKVEAGRTHFLEVLGEHAVGPVLDHYMCMIDLLGRSGRLHECEELIHSMPFEPDPMAWVTLLSACKLHGDVECGKRASQCVSEIAPGHGSHNVLMSNILQSQQQRQQSPG